MQRLSSGSLVGLADCNDPTVGACLIISHWRSLFKNKVETLHFQHSAGFGLTMPYVNFNAVPLVPTTPCLHPPTFTVFFLKIVNVDISAHLYIHLLFLY